MPDNTGMLTGTIDDYLLGLADGLQKAQASLNQVSLIVQKDEPPITYQIPRLDFELKLAFELVISDDGEDSKQLRFKTPGGGQSSRQTTTEATSTIRGTLMAVPRAAGKPQPIIQTTLERVDKNQLNVIVTTTTSAGEKMVGVEVHFNIDRIRSRDLSQSLANLPAKEPLEPRPETTFFDAVVETDATGTAIGVLTIGADEPLGKCIAVIVDVLGQTETIMLQRD